MAIVGSGVIGGTDGLFKGIDVILHIFHSGWVGSDKFWVFELERLVLAGHKFGIFVKISVQLNQEASCGIGHIRKVV